MSVTQYDSVIAYLCLKHVAIKDETLRGAALDSASLRGARLA